MNRKLFQILASKIQAFHFCQRSGNDWADKHLETITALVKEHLPSGSGFDDGTTLDVSASTGEKLVFSTSFHHMDEYGGYDGWSEHTVTIKSSLVYGFTLSVSGRDRNGIKDYIADMFRDRLETEVTYEDERQLAERLGHITEMKAA